MSESAVDAAEPREFIAGLLGEAVERINEGASQTLTARRTTEVPPRDPRHLTDTRTRVSTLLEYSLAYEMNAVLAERGEGDTVSAVLWNVFPDLLIRDTTRAPKYGLEVKALHTAAEEKSANFMTPLQLIRKGYDYVVIINWGWHVRELREGLSITYPRIHEVGVFDAWELAKIRDYSWLYRHGARRKAIDLCSPLINGAENLFKAEEGNLGKLMRIQLPEGLPQTVPGFQEMQEENARYAAFKRKILALALRETFLDICLLEGATEFTGDELIEYPATCQVAGNALLRGGRMLRLLAGPRPDRWLQATDPGGDARFLWLSPKLEWRIYARTPAGWELLASGLKPDSDLERIAQNLR